MRLRVQTRTGWGIYVMLITTRRDGSAHIRLRTIPWRSGLFGWG